MNKLNISESDKNTILTLYNENYNNEEYIISDWVSPDDKFVIFLDNLIDVEKKQLIGNIWENFDNFKMFLKHSFEVSKNIPKTIKEEVLNSINKLVITESTQNYSYLKPYVKNILIESNVFKDFTDWGKKQLSSAVDNTINFAKTVGGGAVDFVKSIGSGDWAKALDIIGKGVVYLMRSVRGFMYHPVGLVIDAIFVTLAPATLGVTEVLKWLPWLVIVILDILEIVNVVEREEPDLPMWARILFLGFDVLGLVTTGAVAKTSKSFIQGLGLFGKSTNEAAALISKTPKAKGVIQKMYNSLDKLPNFFKSAEQYLSKSKIGGYFSRAFSNLGKIISQAKNQLGRLLGTSVGKSSSVGATTTGLVYGFEKGADKVANYFGNLEDPNDYSEFFTGQADYGDFG